MMFTYDQYDALTMQELFAWSRRAENALELRAVLAGAKG